MKPLQEGNPVYFRTPQNKWGAGKIISKDDRKYEILSEDGTIYKRNRVHIRQKHTPFDNTLEAILTSPDNGWRRDATEPDQQQNEKTTRVRKSPAWHEDFIRH